MKKLFTISLVLVGLFAFTACGKNDGEKKESVYESTMKEYAINYYNYALKGTEGLTEKDITVGKLRDAVNKNVVNYDMSKLANCTDESYVKLIINQTNNDVDKVEFHMSCEK